MIKHVKRLLQFPERLEVLQREVRLLARQLTRPQFEMRFAAPQLPDGQMITQTRLCRQEDFEQPWFAHWMSLLKIEMRYHRKIWEFAYVCQAVAERGVLRPGARGLGFGVGGERLPALFAAMGCDIVATDQGVARGLLSGWVRNEQHASGLQGLRHPAICPDAVFERQVSFRPVNMNAVPNDLRDFDFCWSACALEHLGSIERGLRFIERSTDCLKPGGVAVHTTEFNLSSDRHTIDHEGTVLFRRQDFVALERRLKAKGLEVTPLNLDPGVGKLDQYIDMPPYLEEPHLKLALSGFEATSIGLVITRP